MIVTDLEQLQQTCDKIESKEEGEAIAKQLWAELEKTPGLGIAAPQIGIQKQVCVINTPIHKWTLFNPYICCKSTSTVKIKEGCLSMPGREIVTRRHQAISIACDWLNPNIAETRGYHYMQLSEHHRYVLSFGAPSEIDMTDLDSYFSKIIECVVVQHEIDHLHGTLMIDRAYE